MPILKSIARLGPMHVRYPLILIEADAIRRHGGSGDSGDDQHRPHHHPDPDHVVPEPGNVRKISRRQDRRLPRQHADERGCAAHAANARANTKQPSSVL